MSKCEVADLLLFYMLLFHVKMRGSRSIVALHASVPRQNARYQIYCCLTQHKQQVIFEFHTVRTFFLSFGRSQIICFFRHHVTTCFNILLQKLCLFLIRIRMGSNILREFEGRDSIALFYFLFCFILLFLLL